MHNGVGHAAMQLPNRWRYFNLRESPFFQDTLGHDGARTPLDLFVGREPELERLLAGIGGAGASRQALGGAPGVGKTTLVQVAKARAVAAGYLATDAILSFYPKDTAEAVFARVLGGVYEALLAVRPALADNSIFQQVQQYVAAFRLGGGGGGFSFAGVGLNLSQTSSAVTPPHSLLIVGPKLLRDMLDLATQPGNFKGVVLHLNNLENLSEADLEGTADILRSLRDPVLMQSGLHTILVGATNAVTKLASAHPQLRSVLSVQMLEAMPVHDVDALLAARYAHLVLNPASPPIAPLEPAAVHALYPMFLGDLRAFLQALEEGVTLLAGLVPGRSPSHPLPLDALRRTLKARYGELLAEHLTEARVEQLTIWAEQLGVTTLTTQDALVNAWGITQPSASTALKDMVAAGYVVALPRRGAEPTAYALTGRARLAFE